MPKERQAHIYWHKPSTTWRLWRREDSVPIYYGSCKTYQQAEALARTLGLIPHNGADSQSCAASEATSSAQDEPIQLPGSRAAAALTRFRVFSEVYGTTLPADLRDLEDRLGAWPCQRVRVL
jgi:hypothetical protein